MATHLYCLIDTDEAPLAGDIAVPGVGGASVRAVPLAPVDGLTLVAWVSTIDADQIPREMAALRTIVLEHDRVVHAALEHARTVVPALLGDPYRDDAECAAGLEARTAEIGELWQRAHDQVEMTLIVARHPPEQGEAHRAPIDGPDAGRRYLERLRDQRDAVGATVGGAADALAGAVRSLVGATVRRDGEDRIAISHEISRDAVTAYRSAIAALDRPDGLTVAVDGPRAPYSFAALTAPDPRHDSSDLSGSGGQSRSR